MNKIVTIIRESRLARFLIPAGIMLLVFGIIFFIANNNNKDYIETEATVTKVELEQEARTDANGNPEAATYKVNIKYTVGGKEYEAELGGVSEYKVGDKMKIFYNPADPGQVTMMKSLLLPIILIAGGIAMLVCGVLSGVNAVKRYQKMKKQEEEWKNG